MSTSTARGAPAAAVGAYPPTAIALHWLLALLLAGSFAVGLYMTTLGLSPLRLRLYNWHKWAGATILALAVLRLALRLLRGAPAPPPMARWQQRAAAASHALMYVLFLLIPLAGWLYSSAAGFPVVVFGVLPLPDLLAPDKPLAELLKPWHGRLAWVLAALVVLHAAAALKHHLIDRDGLLLRMWPRRS